MTNEDDEEPAAKRKRLLAILARDYPARKPGARTGAWELEHERALRELRRFDVGEVDDWRTAPW